MTQREIESFLRAYCQGTTSADFLQLKLNGQWTASLWTIPPCNPVAAENAGRQFTRMRATEIRWVRKAHLKIGEEKLDAVIFTEFPSQRQKVIDLSDGKTIQMKKYLEDATAKAISGAFTA